MIYAFILRYWRVLLPVVAAVVIFAAYRWHVATKVEQARADDAAEAARMDAVADDIAGQIAASEAATVEQENTDARKAAAGSDDGLKSALDRLRTGKTGDRKTAP